jgi:hypothetical protein
VPSLASLPKQKLNSLNAYSFYQPQWVRSVGY